MSTATAEVSITEMVREKFTAAPLNCVIGQPNLGSICLTTFDVAELHVAITENVVSLKVLTAMVPSSTKVCTRAKTTTRKFTTRMKTAMSWKQTRQTDTRDGRAVSNSMQQGGSIAVQMRKIG